MKTISSFLKICALSAVAVAFSACDSVPYEDSVAASVDFAASQDDRKIELLSRHDTNAVFTGTREQRCMGRSMLCPDRCGHSGTVAVFEIESYNAYSCPGKYGDPTTGEFICMLKPEGTTEVSAATVEKIRALSPGDKVRLVWDHIYVSDAGGSFPERPIRFLDPNAVNSIYAKSSRGSETATGQ